VLNYDHWGIKAKKADLFADIAVAHELGTEEIFSNIESVTFMDSVCVVRKKKSPNHDLGPRIGSGSDAIVHPVVKTLVGEKSQTPTQEQNRFAILDDLNFVNKRKLASQNQELASQNQELNDSVNHLVSSIDSMRNTISWKLTTPLRHFRVLLSRLFDQG